MILQPRGRCSAVGVTSSYPLKHTPGRKCVTEGGHQPQTRWVALVLTEGKGKKRLHGSLCAHSYRSKPGAGTPNPIPSAHCPCAEVTHLLTRAITPEMYTVGLGGLENREGKGGFKEQFTQGGRRRGTAEGTRVSSGDFCLTRN